MKTSPQGLALIKAFEGLRLTTYRDAAGVPTIGYGHTDAAGPPKVKPGMQITEAEAEAILAADLIPVEKQVAEIITIPLTQYEFDALVSFHFNTGALRKGSVDDKLNKGDRASKDAAMDTLVRYVYAKGHMLTGLARRREAERLLFEGKIHCALELAGVKDVCREPVITNPTYVSPVEAPKPVKKKDCPFLRLIRNLVRRFRHERIS